MYTSYHARNTKLRILATSAYKDKTLKHRFHANILFLAIRFQKRNPCFPRFAEAVKGVLNFLALIDPIRGVPVRTGVTATLAVPGFEEGSCRVCFTGVKNGVLYTVTGSRASLKRVTGVFIGVEAY